MNPFALTVFFADGTEKTVEASAPELVAFEERFSLSVVKLENDLKLTHLFFMAWHGLKRRGETADEFEKWIESVSMVALADQKKLKG